MLVAIRAIRMHPARSDRSTRFDSFGGRDCASGAGDLLVSRVELGRAIGWGRTGPRQPSSGLFDSAPTRVSVCARGKCVDSCQTESAKYGTFGEITAGRRES